MKSEKPQGMNIDNCEILSWKEVKIVTRRVVSLNGGIYT